MMRNPFRFIPWAIAMLTATVLFLGPAFADVIEIKAASPYPMQHYLTADAFELYGQEIEKRTNGKVKFKWYHAGTIAPWPTSYDAVTNGLCDLGVGGTVFHVKKMPITMGLNLPFVTDSAKHAAMVALDMYDSIPEMKKEYRKVKVLGLFSTANVNLHTLVPPFKTLADIKGVRIAAAAPNVITAAKLLGASAQPIKPQDIYMALNRKMIDGVIFPDAPIRSMKLTDLVSNHTMLNLLNATFGIFMNQKTWDKLPADVQKVFEETTLSVSALCGETLNNEAGWVIDELKNRGDNFYYLPPAEKAKWQAAVAPMYKGWIDALNKNGMDGQVIFDKMMAIAEKHRKNPYGTDSWWGNAGRKK